MSDIVSIKYYHANPVQYNGYVIGCESMENALEEIKHMHVTHWNETEILYLTRPIDIDYDRVIAIEKSNRLRLFTVRDSEGTLVGNLMYYLGKSTHFKGMTQATEDSFFLYKHVRQGRLAIKLLKYAEDVLVAGGVQLIGMSDKGPCGGKSLAKMMNMLGYNPVSTNYIKEV